MDFVFILSYKNIIVKMLHAMSLLFLYNINVFAFNPINLPYKLN